MHWPLTSDLQSQPDFLSLGCRLLPRKQTDMMMLFAVCRLAGSSLLLSGQSEPAVAPEPRGLLDFRAPCGEKISQLTKQIKLFLQNTPVNQVSRLLTASLLTPTAKDRGEKKLFGYSFVPLMQEDGRTLPDGTHELIIHKVTNPRPFTLTLLAR